MLAAAHEVVDVRLWNRQVSLYWLLILDPKVGVLVVALVVFFKQAIVLKRVAKLLWLLLRMSGWHVSGRSNLGLALIDIGLPVVAVNVGWSLRSLRVVVGRIAMTIHEVHLRSHCYV